MSGLAISAHHLSKAFTRRGSMFALRESVERAMRAPLTRGRPAEKGQARWALQDVCFEIRQGEFVGLIGHNGAGKSVLLRILGRVTCPTAGEAELVGQVTAVLEVGAGFRRELTGRENVFFHGAILGMKKNEIARRFDAIAALSGLEEFIDLPLRGYSNGMLVRLAFAVAAQLEPEILLMDEVLAVADADFHRVCVERIHALAGEGCTMLLAGHDLEMIAALCPRTVWLEHGRLAADGPTREVIAQYQAGGAASRV